MSTASAAEGGLAVVSECTGRVLLQTVTDTVKRRRRCVRAIARIAQDCVIGSVTKSVSGDGSSDLPSAASGAPRAASASGTAFGRFRQLHQIGMGSLGPVFRGEDTTTHAAVVIKHFQLTIGPERTRLIADELHALVARMPERSAHSAAARGRTLGRGADDGQHVRRPVKGSTPRCAPTARRRSPTPSNA